MNTVCFDFNDVFNKLQRPVGTIYVICLRTYERHYRTITDNF